MKLQFYKRKIWLFCRRWLSKNPNDFYPHGIKVHIPENADISIRYTLARRRSYEEAEASLIRKYIFCNLNVVELGGCYGVISSLIRDRIGPSAYHIIVEADPRLSDVCKTNVNLQGAEKNTKVLNAAIDYSGSTEINFCVGSNAHVGRIAKYDEPGFSIGTVTLEQILCNFPEGPKALICDIEGAEEHIIQNEGRNLSTFDLIVMEMHPSIYEQGAESESSLVNTILATGFIIKEKFGDVYCFENVM